jgi:glycerophosphoryl diester phosphodiesterase
MSARPLRIGHRGAAGYAPENTLLSIEQALALGVDYIEVDIQRTLDGHLVILHDKRVDRTTNGHGYIADMTLSQARQLDAGDGQAIPTLADVLKTCSGRAGLLLELISENIAKDVVAACQREQFDGPVIYSSFLHDEILAVRAIEPAATTLALMEAIPVNRTTFAQDAGANYAGLGFDSVRPQIVDELHRSGVKVFTYTLNDARDIELAVSWGIDGIISDYPDRIPRGLVRRLDFAS